ncbi:hypothetical protein KN1_11320 [Stygiolobus caldivivus]|uniref:Uncharacterized protein n=1 Tax=Stygiolobus caldivivus TaxID=2824673 RepID=A0A8D5U5D7_9CREN|nr:hypothetical protein KN1_11320 [Stygiolobus caldivivus]
MLYVRFLRKGLYGVPIDDVIGAMLLVVIRRPVSIGDLTPVHLYVADPRQRINKEISLTFV